MPAINWVLFNERVVGQGSPIFPDDVDNRPLKEVFVASGLNISDNFPGFPPEYKGNGSPEGVQIANPGALYFQEDTPFALWLKKQNIDATGWSKVGGVGPGTQNVISMFDSSGANVVDSIMFQDAEDDAIVIGTDPDATADEVLRLIGGIISQGVGVDSFIAGRGATSDTIDGVAIGREALATIGFGSDGAIAIGGGAAATDGDISIGFSQSFGGGITIGVDASGGNAQSITIGREANSRFASVGATIGYQARMVTASFPIAYESFGVVLGAQCTGDINSSTPSDIGFVMAIGYQADAMNIGAIALGSITVVNAQNAIALGNAITINAVNTGAIGIGQGVIVGTAAVTINDSVVIGAGSNADTSSVPLTVGSAIIIVGPRNTVSSLNTGGFGPADDIYITGAGNTVVNNLGGSFNNIFIFGKGVTANAPAGLVLVGSLQQSLPDQFGGTLVGAFIRIDSGNALTIFGSSARNVGGNDNTIIGRGAQKSGATGAENIIIGSLASADTVDRAIVIGGSASVVGGGATNCIAIGYQSSVPSPFTSCIVLGALATATANNQVIIGSNATGADFRIFIFGNKGDASSTINNVIWRITNASGADLAAGSLTIQPGLSTGAGVGGNFVIQTGTLGGSGSTIQTPAARITALGGMAGTQVFIGGDPGGTETFRVGGSFAINDPTRLVSNKQAFTDGAGAGLGTLTNAPTAGDPTKWIEIDDNGTLRYIPCW